jgi:hypothetical protein
MWLWLTQIIPGYPDVRTCVNLDNVTRIIKKVDGGAALLFVDGRGVDVRESAESIAEKVSK